MVSPRRRHGRPVDFKRGRVEMAHGGGGKAMAALIDELFVKHFDNPWLSLGKSSRFVQGDSLEGRRRFKVHSALD